ncbi:hypothetical protein SORBI_3003G077200 [Sorghum bicolor]|uniref:Uncharacterized protein n=1 Tax=Sorghum bicolor TaxID=4558 RepID=A0A194YP26_SORBI|nr:hypothetical protein SORBI_3003G077200 [Sorghum bicolor]
MAPRGSRNVCEGSRAEGFASMSSSTGNENVYSNRYSASYASPPSYM